MVADIPAATVAGMSGVGAGASVGIAAATMAATVASRSGVGVGVAVGRAAAMAAWMVASMFGAGMGLAVGVGAGVGGALPAQAAASSKMVRVRAAAVRVGSFKVGIRVF